MGYYIKFNRCYSVYILQWTPCLLAASYLVSFGAFGIFVIWYSGVVRRPLDVPIGSVDAGMVRVILAVITSEGDDMA